MSHYLAFSDPFTALNGWYWVAFVAVAIAVGLVIQWAVGQMRKMRGPVVEGTADVLSMKQFGTVGSGAGRRSAVAEDRPPADVRGRPG
jgi:hypothetical protein